MVFIRALPVHTRRILLSLPRIIPAQVPSLHIQQVSGHHTWPRILNQGVSEHQSACEAAGRLAFMNLQSIY